MFQPVSQATIQRLMQHGACGVLPAGAENADWFATTDDGTLALVLLDETSGTWRFLVCRRCTDWKFQRAEHGEGFLTAFEAVDELRGILGI